MAKETKVSKKAARDEDDDDLDLTAADEIDGDESEEIEEEEDETPAPKKKVASSKPVKRNREEDEVEEDEDEEKPSKKAAVASKKVVKGDAKMKTATKKASGKPKTMSVPKSAWETPYRPGSFSETIFKKAQAGIKVKKIHAFGKENGANAGAVYRLVKQLHSGEQNGRRWTVDAENGFLQVTLKKAASLKKAA